MSTTSKMFKASLGRGATLVKGQKGQQGKCMKRTSKMTKGIFTMLLGLTVVAFTSQALAQTTISFSTMGPGTVTFFAGDARETSFQWFDCPGGSFRCGTDTVTRGAEHDEDSFVARLGGDEFTIVLEDVAEPGDLAKVAARIAQKLPEPIRIGPHELSVTGSMGLATWPQDGEDLETLLRKTDAAMVQAKGVGPQGAERRDLGALL